MITPHIRFTHSQPPKNTPQVLRFKPFSLFGACYEVFIFDVLMSSLTITIITDRWNFVKYLLPNCNIFSYS